MNKNVIDPISVEVLGNALLTIAEEMGATLIKASFSPNIKERQDSSSAIFNQKGETIAQASAMPLHLGSLLGICKEVLDKFDLEDIEEGDVFIANDPYSGGGTHLPDITLAQPVFFKGELVAFVANIAHHSDVGGRVAGSNSGDSTSIFQEGIRVPPIKLIKKGEIVQDVLDMILLNVRTPEERLGDLKAQIASNKVGDNRVTDLITKYGEKAYKKHLNELLLYTERKIKEGIKSIPDGEYTFTDFLDDDGVDFNNKNIPIKVNIRVSNENIHLDFTGSSNQVKGGINIVEFALLSIVYYTIKVVVDPSIPSNAGYYKAIDITAPKGTIVNAMPPAAVAGRSDACQRVADAIFGAFAKALPKRVIAGSNSAVTFVSFDGEDTKRDRYFVCLESLGGGLGARFNKDGLDGVHVHMTNSLNTPVESIEAEYPFIINKYELRQDSGGAGKYRGGLGFRRDYLALEDVEFSTHGDRQIIPPWGLYGGLEGMGGRFVINPDTDKEEIMPSGKSSSNFLKKGSILSVQTPGSGGYGIPSEREHKRILEDIQEEKISEQSAEKQYYIKINKRS